MNVSLSFIASDVGLAWIVSLSLDAIQTKTQDERRKGGASRMHSRADEAGRVAVRLEMLRSIALRRSRARGTLWR